MRRSTLYRAATVAIAAVALAACSDSTTQPAARRLDISSPSFVITPVLSDVIVGSGTFANAIVPTEVGRATGAFWDNVSSDDGNFPPTTVHCNIGFFAIGTISPGCAFKAAGSTPGGFANYYGSGTGNLGSPDFMFKGKYSYDVKLVGAYSFGSSTVGWFTKSGGVYTLHAVPTWSSKSIGTAVTVNTLGLDWGFFASNANFTGVRTCGATTNTSCSDATGGFVAQPFQQHALFINAAGDQFLVGLEDNLLGLWTGNNPNNPTNQDSDYQDYIFNVVPHVIVVPQICDFITFGRLVTTVGDDKIVISGNAGGNAPGGGILGTIEISVGGVQYHVPTIESYALPTNNPFLGDPFARVITGHSGSHLIELRLRDNPNPGQGEPGTTEGDKVWLKIDGTLVVPTQTLDQGNIQLHLHCRGPGE